MWAVAEELAVWGLAYLKGGEAVALVRDDAGGGKADGHLLQLRAFPADRLEVHAAVNVLIFQQVRGVGVHVEQLERLAMPDDAGRGGKLLDIADVDSNRLEPCYQAQKVVKRVQGVAFPVVLMLELQSLEVRRQLGGLTQFREQSARSRAVENSQLLERGELDGAAPRLSRIPQVHVLQRELRQGQRLAVLKRNHMAKQPRRDEPGPGAGIV